MPIIQQETLRLNVTLHDEASRSIRLLRQDLQAMMGGPGKRQLDQFRREQEELGKQLKQIGELSVGGLKGLLGYVGKWGAAGAAVGGFGLALRANMGVLAEYAEKIRALGNQAQALGVSAPELKSIIKQYEAVGASAGEVTSSMAGFTQVLGEVNRLGSARREEMIHAAGHFSREMVAGIDRVQTQTQLAGKLNEVLIQAQEVYKNRLAETNGNAADAHKSMVDFLGLWGLGPVVTFLDHLDLVSDETRKKQEAQFKNSKLYADKVHEFEHEAEEWANDIKAKFLTADGLVVQGLEKATSILREARELWKTPLGAVTPQGEPIKPSEQPAAKTAAGTLLDRMTGAQPGTQPAPAPETKPTPP